MRWLVNGRKNTDTNITVSRVDFFSKNQPFFIKWVDFQNILMIYIYIYIILKT